MSDGKLADIEYLPGRPCLNSHAALGDAMARAKPTDKLVVMWIDEENGGLRFATANCQNWHTVWLCEAMKAKALG